MKIIETNNPTTKAKTIFSVLTPFDSFPVFLESYSVNSWKGLTRFNAALISLMTLIMI